MIDAAMHKQMLTALCWYADNGVHEAVLDEPEDYTVVSDLQPSPAMGTPLLKKQAEPQQQPQPSFLGKSDAREEAVKRSKGAKTLDELKQAIAEFDGIAIKKTASNLVFSDGHPHAKIMVIGEAPGANEDRMGKPFVGVSGQLLDKILACIGLSRDAEDAQNAVYISNILNWRPPGNRTPNPAEIEVSLPFIERHIQLIKPEILILFGGVSAKALLATDTSISRLRRTEHLYKTLTEELGGKVNLTAYPTYHPSYLLRTPIQKKAVWEDMLKIKKKMQK